MPTLELTPSGVERPREVAARTAAPSNRTPAALAVGLGVLATYAAFAHGATASPAEPRLQVALAALVTAAAGCWLWNGRLRFSAPRAALLGVALLAGFAAWSGLSVIWSVYPDLSWIEFNRTVAYVLILCLGIALGASSERSTVLVAFGFLGLVALVTLYALGQKLLPGLHVGSLIVLNQTGKIARLQEPLGYWNALALLLLTGAPAALALASRELTPVRLRLGGLVLLQLIFLAVGFTLSRGGLLAFFLALAAFVALSGSPLRALMWAGAAIVAALPPLILGLVSHALSTNGVTLGRRESAGLLLLLVLAACIVVLALGAERLLALERTVRPSAQGRARIIRALWSTAGALVVILLIAVAVSSRGLTGTVSHLWSSFTATRGIAVSNPNRLLSADSANRWVWWKQALGAFSARPLIGWGAGSFPIVNLLFRHDTLTVNHPHSVPLQWLAETGLVGAALAIAGWGMLLRTGFAAVRRQPASGERLVRAALLAGVLAYTVHAFYDWDWDIPGVTLPVLVMAGVLAGSLRARPLPSVAPIQTVTPIQSLVAPVPALNPERGPATRLLGLALVAICACLFAASAVLPSLAAGRASAALVAASQTSKGSLNRAHQDAAQASRLDPLSAAGPWAEAAVAQHRGDLAIARAYLLDALNRQPSDEAAWEALVDVDAELGRLGQSVAAAQQLFELDPYGTSARVVAFTAAQQATLREAPPADTATSLVTPGP